MNLIVVLASALAVALLGDLWLFHSRDVALERASAQEQAVRNVQASAEACSSSVEALAKKTDDLGDRIDKRLELQGGQIRDLEHQATKALQARPDNPADLCGSLMRYWRGEISREVKP